MAITNGIKISVETFYQSQHSKPVDSQYVFAYRVTIENISSRAVQLLSRQWQILDSTGMRREVEGEGVIGQQPTILPGTQHQYVSWCSFSTGLGSMHGSYLMRGVGNSEQFRVQIPRFQMEAFPLLN